MQQDKYLGQNLLKYGAGIGKRPRIRQLIDAFSCISPGLIFVQKAVLLGLLLEGFIIAWA